MPAVLGVFLGLHFVVLAVLTTVHHLYSLADPCSATIARQVLKTWPSIGRNVLDRAFRCVLDESVFSG